MCSVLHERSNMAASFTEHQKFKEKVIFNYELWLISSNMIVATQNKKKKNQDTRHFEIVTYRVLHLKL